MQRKQKFDELLQINKYETVRSNCLTAINRIKKANEEKINLIENQKKTFNEQEINELMKKNELQKKEIEQKEKEEKELQKNIIIHEKKIKEKEIHEKKFRELNNLLNEIKGKIDSAEQELKKIEEHTKNNSIQKMKNELNEINTVIELIPEQKKQKTNELTKLEELYSEKLKELSEITAQKNQVKQGKQKLNEIKANCPICKKPMEEHSKKELNQEYENELQKLEELNELKEKKFNELKEKKTKIKNEIEFIAEKEKKLIEEKHELKEKIKEIELKNKKEKELNELKEKEKKLIIVIEKNEFNEKKFNELKEKFYSTKEKINSIQKEINGKKELISNLLERINDINKFKNTIQKLQEKVLNSKKMNEKLSIFMNSLKQTQNELRTVLIDSINEAMKTIWPQVYPYKDFSSAKIIIKNGEYEVMVKNNENEFVRVEGILSGGERTAAAITLRIAFSLVLTRNLGWIILDEPTHNLDLNSVKELSSMLGKHLPEIVEQVFVITHDNEMKSAATGKLYLLERKKEEFESTNIIEANSL
jgi:DNA repair protein SbcC/Rad50